MKYLFLLMPAMAFCCGPEEIKQFAINQKMINEVYYYESEDTVTDSFFKGKMQAYDEVFQFIKRNSYED